MNVPQNLRYTKNHEWFDPSTGRIGLTDYAQSALGDIVFVSIPSVGDKVKSGSTFTDVESVKAVADIASPVSGKISAVNEELADSPETINADPYGAWVIEVRIADDVDNLLNADQYMELLNSL